MLQVDGEDGPSTSGKLEGSGKLEFLSGCTYEGDLVGGRMHGQGKMTFPDNCESRPGEWPRQFMHILALGTPPAVVYEGDWLENCITGQGVSP